MPENPNKASSADNVAAAEEGTQPHPRLLRDPSFLGMTATQFLGAFNDNLFKQLMLLLAVPIGAAATAQDQQGVATFVFSVPFVLFSGYAGFLSDRYSKTPIVVAAKVAEIGVMLLGMLAFLMYAGSGYIGLLFVLFLMGAQSTFFGPGKYGILPEMLRASDLPRANGIMVMTTFLAIILGIAAAGPLRDFLDQDRPLTESAHQLWIGSAICIVIAILGTLTSLAIRRVPAAKPDLRFQWSALAIPPETRAVLRADRPLLLAVLASCVFWLVSAITAPAVNSLGLVQFKQSSTMTSLLTAVIAIGVAMGAVIAGKVSHGRADFRLVRIGLWGLVVFLALLSIVVPGRGHMLGFGGSLLSLSLLGISAGFFAIPVQVFIQARPPSGQKGRMIAVMNQCNFIAMMLAGPIYQVFDRVAVAWALPRSAIFAMIAVLVLPLAICYRPSNEDH